MTAEKSDRHMTRDQIIAGAAVAGMKAATAQVAEFHCVFEYPMMERLDAYSDGVSSAALAEMAAVLHEVAVGLAGLYAKTKDQRLLRCHLPCEELAELLEAMAVLDERRVLDALADMEYVTHGTAVTFDLPLADAFAEVHRSNMTKTVREDRPGHPAKGPEFSPPDLRRVLEDHWKRRAIQHDVEALRRQGAEVIE
jgi:predicted HAD superfamily Cof-like phosphohydrolase